MEKEVRDMDIGSLAAEDDSHLEDYFIETSIYRRVLTGNTKVLVGARGSGKSAIFRKIAKEATSKGSLVENVIPNDYIADLVKSTKNIGESSDWIRLGLFTAAWKYVILLIASKKLYQKYKNSSSHKDSVRAIQSFLRENDSEYKKKATDLFVSLLQKVKRTKKVSLSSVEFSDIDESLEGFYNLEKIRPLFEPIRNLSQNTKVLVLFDELDHGWDASDESRQFIASLFRAALYVNKEFTGVNALITIREEIYQNIPELYDDAQKIRDRIDYVRWTQDELLEMATKRIKLSMEGIMRREIKAEKSNSIWELVFPKTLGPRRIKSFKYVLDRTTFRPRELIYMINEIFKVHNLEEKITLPTIEKAERIYSMHRTQDIGTEYSFQYPGLKDLFELFRNRSTKWDRESLEDMWLEIVEGNVRCSSVTDWINESSSPYKLIEALWKSGFLRVFTKIDKQPTKRDEKYYLGYYQDSTLNPDMYIYFDVHPMFRMYLGNAE